MSPLWPITTNSSYPASYPEAYLAHHYKFELPGSLPGKWYL